jgi:hypothetical protein
MIKFKEVEESLPVTKKAQRDRFIEAAGQLGADEDEAAFDAKLGVIARQKPKDETKPKKNDR